MCTELTENRIAYSDVTALTVLYITKDSGTKVGNLNLNGQKKHNT
jgi:hypothetical protein